MSGLAKCIGVASGLTFDQSLARAEQAVFLLSADAEVHLSANLARLLELVAQCQSQCAHALAPSIHHTTSEIHAIGGTFGHAELSNAAKLMSDFVAETANTTKWSPKTLLVFASALSSLHREGKWRSDASRALLGDLQILASRVLAGRCVV